MSIIFWIILFFLICLLLAYHKATMAVWTTLITSFLIVFSLMSQFGVTLLGLLWGGFILLAVLLNYKPLRMQIITKYIYNLYCKALPHMSITEMEALAAGTVSWDKHLFEGNIQWRDLLKQPQPKLSKQEQAFLDGPVTQLCAMINDWEINYTHTDIAPEVVAFIKEQGFLGMIIPKKYGGLGFSSYAHSQVLVKIGSRNGVVGAFVGVPNSLGPAELILAYGTEEQKTFYLPRLAKGLEVPCFALTSAHGGSDASAMLDHGQVCYQDYQGEKTLGILLNWKKRYITLAPIATLLGLAFKLYDPDHLLGEKDNIGITCALVPTNHPGVNIGRRHLTSGVYLPNGPTSGENVFIPLDWIIGGKSMMGQGWRMLMESLAVGRAISLPAGAIASSKMMVAASTAYTKIRRQFNLPIANFEGVQEALADIIGYTYIIDAVRSNTAALIDQGEEPAVLSAITKYFTSEYARKVILSSMDIHGGKGICVGPKNYLFHHYLLFPIGITVEGANILTRSMIIFGQGAIRCHPYMFKEMEMVRKREQGDIKEFDTLIFKHLSFTVGNFARTFFAALTGGRTVKTPDCPIAHYMRTISRFSMVLALLADVAMLSIGGQLKRKEMLSGRFADLLGFLYQGTCVIKRFHDNQCQEDELPLFQWSMETILYKIQTSIDTLLANYPYPMMSHFLRIIVFPYGKRLTKPRDELTKSMVDAFVKPSSLRERVLTDVDLDAHGTNLIGKMQDIFVLAVELENAEARIAKAVHAEEIKKELDYFEQIDLALNAEVISKEEAKKLNQLEKARQEIISVDDFDYHEFAKERDFEEFKKVEQG